MVGGCEEVVDGEADDGVGHAGGVGEVLAGGAGQASVSGEGADEGIEVATGVDAVFAQLEIELIARHAVGLGIDEDGEVAVVVAHARHVVPEGDALDGAQGLAVTYGDLMARLDSGIDLTQVEQAEGSTHLVHLAVDAGCDDLGLAGEAEVLEVIDAFFGLLVVNDQGTALGSAEDLGGMETERGHVALAEDALAVDLDAESVGGIVDDAQAVLVGDVLNLTGSAGLTIDVDGHDGSGARRDGCLDAVGVDVTCCHIDVDEHGLNAVPPQRVGRCHEAVGRGDDLAADVEGLKGGNERQSSIGEHADVGHLEVLAQGCLETAVEITVVSHPLAVPNLAEHLVILIEVRQEGRRYRDDIFILFHSKKMIATAGIKMQNNGSPP